MSHVSAQSEPVSAPSDHCLCPGRALHVHRSTERSLVKQQPHFCAWAHVSAQSEPCICTERALYLHRASNVSAPRAPCICTERALRLPRAGPASAPRKHWFAKSELVDVPKQQALACQSEPVYVFVFAQLEPNIGPAAASALHVRTCTCTERALCLHQARSIKLPTQKTQLRTEHRLCRWSQVLPMFSMPESPRYH